MTDIAKAAQESSDLALWQAYCEKKMALEDAADEIERLRAECQRLAGEVSRAHKDALTWMERAAAVNAEIEAERDAARDECDDAVKYLARMREIMVNAGFPGGDRYQGLANLETLVSQRDAARAEAAMWRTRAETAVAALSPPALDAEDFAWARSILAAKEPGHE